MSLVDGFHFAYICITFISRFKLAQEEMQMRKAQVMVVVEVFIVTWGSSTQKQREQQKQQRLHTDIDGGNIWRPLGGGRERRE